MRRVVLAALLAAAASAPAVTALAEPDADLFRQREAGGPDARYRAAIDRGYEALAAGRQADALAALRAADGLPLHEAANYALLPQIAWLQARAGRLDEARRTALEARLALDLESGAARCTDTTLDAKAYAIEVRTAAARRYCNAFGDPRPDALYKRKLAAVEAQLR